jgi:hypothetical protein
MARSLLETLHLHAALAAAAVVERARPPPEERGASPAQIARLPLREWSSEAECGEADDVCPICLSGFRAGDSLRELPCRHWHHQACLDQWLGIKNCWCEP